VALLRHNLRENVAEPLEADSLALTLARRALGPRTTHAANASVGRQRLVDRIKLLLASDLARRWSLGEIAAEVRGSPVYLTQVFQQVEGLPLYRYQLRLRLARALDLLAQYSDLTTLSLDLGFSSHSHFSAASPGLRAFALGFQAVGVASLGPVDKVAKDFDSDALSRVVYWSHPTSCPWRAMSWLRNLCRFGRNSMRIRSGSDGGKTVEVCCDECAQKLKEAHASVTAARGLSDGGIIAAEPVVQHRAEEFGRCCPRKAARPLQHLDAGGAGPSPTAVPRRSRRVAGRSQTQTALPMASAFRSPW
jgi:AraC-like DNA-binding protein